MANISQVCRVGKILWEQENPKSKFAEPPSFIYESIEKMWDKYYYEHGEQPIFTDEQLIEFIRKQK